MIDLEPATSRLASIVEGVRDDQLSAATPCASTTVGDLLNHVDGLALAFTAAATKTRLPEGQGQASADASQLAAGWRSRIPERLTGLAHAWRDDAAWAGMTQAGGQDMPGELAGVIALDEVIVHGWDIAAASGQDYGCQPELAEVALAFAQQTATSSPEGTPGLFGPPVPVPAETPVLHRLLGCTGRDPGWPNRDGRGGRAGDDRGEHSGPERGADGRG